MSVICRSDAGEADLAEESLILSGELDSCLMSQYQTLLQ